MAIQYIPDQPLPESTRARLERFVRGTSIPQLRAMLRGVDPAAVARAAAGMKISAATHRKIEGLLPTLEGAHP